MNRTRGNASTQIIWLSDLHFERDGLVQGHDPRLRLDAAIAHINTHYRGAEACLITGDMVDTATHENYQDLRQRLEQLAMPWWPMTGNHDKRALFLQHMPQPSGGQEGFAQYAIDLQAARLICLDSLWEGEDAGHLCDARLVWLEARLNERQEVPALIFLHHPPLDLGLPMLDPDRLQNGDTLLRLLARYPHVTQLCCGHVHRPISGRIGALSYATIRAVLYQAPPPVPAWDWDSFNPPMEAPDFGVITVSSGDISIQFAEFCPAEYGIKDA